MNDNIGSNIKGLAKFLGWFLLICGIIGWFIFVADWGIDESLPWILLGSGVGGFFSSWALYGFGQIVEDVHAMRQKMTASAETRTEEVPES